MKTPSVLLAVLLPLSRVGRQGLNPAASDAVQAARRMSGQLTTAITPAAASVI